MQSFSKIFIFIYWQQRRYCFELLQLLPSSIRLLLIEGGRINGTNCSGNNLFRRKPFYRTQ